MRLTLSLFTLFLSQLLIACATPIANCPPGTPVRLNGPLYFGVQGQIPPVVAAPPPTQPASVASPPAQSAPPAQRPAVAQTTVPPPPPPQPVAPVVSPPTQPASVASPPAQPPASEQPAKPERVAPPKSLRVKLFFLETTPTGGLACGKIVIVEREIGNTPRIAHAVLSELLRGPNEEEKARGVRSALRQATSVKVEINSNKVATVRFGEVPLINPKSDCDQQGWEQITSTLLQFPTVKDVDIFVRRAKWYSKRT